MRRVLSTVIVLGALVALAWGAASVNIRGRTAFGHVRAWSKSVHVLPSVVAWARHALDFTAKGEDGAPRKPRAKTAATAVERAATPRRVALLENAAREAGGGGRMNAGKPSDRPPRTRIDERISPQRKKALDDLVSSRVTRD